MLAKKFTNKMRDVLVAEVRSIFYWSKAFYLEDLRSSVPQGDKVEC